MADEITVNLTLSVLKPPTITPAVAKQITSKTFDMAGTDFAWKTQEIGTTEEALDLGEVTTPGYCLIINRDPTNFVSVRAATALADTIKLEAAGGMAFFMFAATAPFAIADTGACRVEFMLFEA